MSAAFSIQLRCVARLREIFRQCVARLAPLRALVARLAEAQLAARAGCRIDDLQAFVGMIGVAEDALAARSGAMCQALYSAMVEIWRVVQSMRHSVCGQTVKTRSPVAPRKVSWTTNSSLPCW